MWKKERHRTGEPALGRKLRSGPGTDALQVPTVQGQAEAERTGVPHKGSLRMRDGG